MERDAEFRGSEWDQPLRPCPFCGRQPNLTSRRQASWETAPWVSFLSCMCGGYSARAHQFATGDSEAETVAEVTAKWNTRHEAV